MLTKSHCTIEHRILKFCAEVHLSELYNFVHITNNNGDTEYKFVALITGP